ncbi:transcription factor Adf-1-like [Amyelois transitella]|uniref:transcription factor Adf-1-like n=1 Tax=Amyelois transitella TaxID=680683 RepID=UPI00298FFFC6|nr:transcription factor Adf-1-like [Amyelois transitella]
MSVVWGNDTVLLLIELYESRDLLWDTSHRDYRNKIKKNDAWEDIAKALKLPRKEIEAKVHTLRSQFVRERKKVKSSKTTGSGREDMKSSAWFAYDAMKFLLKGATTSGSLDTLDTNSPQSQNTISSPDEDVVLQSQSTVPEFQSPHQLESQSTIDQAEQPTTPAPTPSSSRPTRKRSHPNEDRLEEAYEVLHAAKNRMMSRDEFDVYGQYVGTELRALNDEHSVIMAKYYINNILLDARLGKYRTIYNNQSQPVVQQGYSTASSDISPEPSEEHIIQDILETMDSSNTNSIDGTNTN